MPQITIVPDDLFARVFGQVALPRVISSAVAQLARTSGIRVNGTDGAVATTSLGTNVYDLLTVKLSEDDAGYTFPYALVINVKKRKRIVQTDITNKDGEVLEYINKRNPSITVKGFITNGGVPMVNTDEVRSLEEYLDYAGTLIVESQYLNDLGIKTAVVTDWDFMPIAGANYLPFTVELIANDPEEYRVLSENFIIEEVGV